MNPFISCKELAEFLGELFDGKLAAEQRCEFDRHMAVCPSCVHYVEQYKTSSELVRHSLGTSGDAPPPADVPEALIRAILATRAKSSS